MKVIDNHASIDGIPLIMNDHERRQVEYILREAVERQTRENIAKDKQLNLSLEKAS